MSRTMKNEPRARTPPRAMRFGVVGAAMGLLWFVAWTVAGPLSSAGWSGGTDVRRF
jgi:hypothetical protein